MSTPNTLSPELKERIGAEAKEKADIQRRTRVPSYCFGYESGYYDGAESVTLKLQQAEERLDQMVKALEWIKIYPTTDDVIKLYIEQHLTEYNNYKQTNNGTTGK